MVDVGTGVVHIGHGVGLATSIVILGAAVKLARFGAQFEGSVQKSNDLVENNSRRCGDDSGKP